jgi:hypothetical protein
MATKAKMRLELVEALQRSLEEVPVHRDDEVTKTDAIRMLAPQIHAIQAKGYSMGAIAQMLSERGLAITATALKSYLSHARSPGARKKARAGRKTKGGAAPKPVAVAVAPVATPSDPAAAPSSADAALSAVATPVPKPVATKAPPTVAARAAAAPAAVTGERRSSFVPRSDTDDI